MRVNVMELGNKPTKGVAKLGELVGHNLTYCMTALIEYLYVLLEYLVLL